jgi:hypothetical protein
MSEAAYLFAILASEEAHRLPPLEDFSVRLPDLGPLALWRVGPLVVVSAAAPEGAPEPRRRNMLAHARLLETLMESCTILPVPFGRVLPGGEAIAAAIEPHAGALLASLDRFRGKAEYGLRVEGDRRAILQAVVDEDPELHAWHARLPRSGPEAYQARIALGQTVAERIAARRARSEVALIEALAPLAEEHVVRGPEDDCQLIRAEFLVARAGEEAFARTVERACAELGPDAGRAPAIRLLGPAPVFNFCTIRLGSAPAAAPSEPARR